VREWEIRGNPARLVVQKIRCELKVIMEPPTMNDNARVERHDIETIVLTIILAGAINTD
jgi:hypothetical protein